MSALHKAFVAALSEMSNPKFDKENLHFKTGYASLASYADTVRPVLGRHGLAVFQPVRDGEGGRVVIDTTILHESGESMTASVSFLSSPKPQEFGSSLTYYRRYALAAMLGIVGEEEDDDGERASKPHAPATSKHVAIGEKGAASLRKTVKGAGLEWATLIADIRGKNPALADTDPAEWGENMKARVVNWCAARAPAKTMPEAMAMLAPKGAKKPEPKEAADGEE